MTRYSAPRLARPTMRHGAAAWRVFTMAATVAMAGCATTGYAPTGVKPGQAESDVVQAMGVPTGRYALPGGGTRLEFARGPFGRDTYMIDLDPSGRVTRWEQVLTEERFATVKPGMARDELLRTLGHPSHVRAVARPERRDVWSYRYHTVPINSCFWFEVSVGAASHQVAETGYGIDPYCDPGDLPLR